jgi:excisionase family DNA binding protein
MQLGPRPVPTEALDADSPQSERRETERPENERQLVFTSSEAADYLGVSLATIRRWADAGHISCYRTPGSQRRFSRSQLDEFLASMQRPGHGAGTRQAA